VNQGAAEANADSPDPVTTATATTSADATQDPDSHGEAPSVTPAIISPASNLTPQQLAFFASLTPEMLVSLAALAQAASAASAAPAASAAIGAPAPAAPTPTASHKRKRNVGDSADSKRRVLAASAGPRKEVGDVTTNKEMPDFGGKRRGVRGGRVSEYTIAQQEAVINHCHSTHCGWPHRGGENGWSVLVADNMVGSSGGPYVAEG